AAERHEVRPSEDETAAVDRLSERRDAQLRHQRQSPVARSVHLPGEVHTTPGPGTRRSRHGGSGRRAGRDGGKCASRHEKFSENPTDSKWWRSAAVAAAPSEGRRRPSVAASRKSLQTV